MIKVYIASLVLIVATQGDHIIRGSHQQNRAPSFGSNNNNHHVFQPNRAPGSTFTTTNKRQVSQPNRAPGSTFTTTNNGQVFQQNRAPGSTFTTTNNRQVFQQNRAPGSTFTNTNNHRVFQQQNRAPGSTFTTTNNGQVFQQNRTPGSTFTNTNKRQVFQQNRAPGSTFTTTNKRQVFQQNRAPGFGFTNNNKPFVPRQGRQQGAISANNNDVSDNSQYGLNNNIPSYKAPTQVSAGQVPGTEFGPELAFDIPGTEFGPGPESPGPEDACDAVRAENKNLTCSPPMNKTVKSIQKDPILQCTHKQVEKCHYTYVTQFEPSQENVCNEIFEKNCQITFKQQAIEETVKKCYTPSRKECNNTGPEECRTVYESSCTTKYVEKQPGGKLVRDTECEKLPVKICGAGCITEEGSEECHNKNITSFVDIPEEVCDLNPQKTCRLQTKLVPRLKPIHECTVFPQEVCHLTFSPPQSVNKTLIICRCMDESGLVKDITYDDSNAGAPVITDLRNSNIQSPILNR